MKITRWLVRIGAGLVLVAVAGVIGLRYYLTSPHVASQAADRLRSILGAPVRVGGADVGLAGSSSLKDVQLFESDKDKHPWAEVREALADVSALGLARGTESPQNLTLRGLAVEIRFSGDGKLLTRLPPMGGVTGGGILPRVRLEGGRLTLRQEGRQPMVLTGITGTAASQPGGGLALKGIISDPSWGNWILDGSFNAGQVALHLTTAGAHVTQARLESIPVIGAGVWKEVRAEGDTLADITLHFSTDGKDAGYRIALEPSRTHVSLPGTGLEAYDASGKVVIDGPRVHLHNVKGRVAGGELALAEADLDFSSTPTRLAFSLTASEVDPRCLPESWRSEGRLAQVLKTFDGDLRLQGRAQLTVTIGADGTVRTEGNGEGEVTGAKLAGKDLKITLRLDSDGNRFRFTAADPLLPLLTTVLLIAPPAPKPPENKPAYLDVNLGLQDVDVAQLIKAVGLELPLVVTGKLTFNVQAAIPLETSGDLKTYRFKGTATLPHLELAGVALRDLDTRVHYENGILHLDQVAGRLIDPDRPADAERSGRFRGTGSWQLVPAGGGVHFDLRLDAAPVAALRPFLPGPSSSAGGALSGSVKADVTSDHLYDPTAWNVEASLKSDEVRLYGWILKKAAADLKAEKGLARLTKMAGELEGAQVTGSAEAELTAPYPYKATLELGETDLAALSRLSPELRPGISIQGRLTSTVELTGRLGERPTLAGTTRAHDLVVEGLAIGNLSSKWTVADSILRLIDLRAKLYEGQLSGTAAIPLEARRAGSADLRFADLDLGALAKTVPNLTLRLEGKASGTVAVQIPATAMDRPRDISADLNLTAAVLKIQYIPTRKLEGKIHHRAGTTDYALVGETLGGRFHLDGKLPPRRDIPPPKEAVEPQGRLRVEGAQLAQLWEALHLSALRTLTGRFDLNLPFRFDPAGRPAGTGRFRLVDLRLGDTPLADDLSGDVVLEGAILDFRDVGGQVAGGEVRIRLRYDIARPERGSFSLSADRLDSAQLLRPLLGTAEYVRGPLTVSVRGQLGQEWMGGGQVELRGARVFGFEVTEWRLPVDFRYTPDQASGEIEIRDSTAQVGNGRATGRARLRWDISNRLEGSLQFSRVEVRQLFGPEGGELSLLGAGRVSGRFDFGAEDLRSPNDLTGTLEASLTETQPLRLPVLRDLVRFITPGQGGARFDNAEVRGRLAGGIFRLQRFTLANAYLRLVLEGSVTLAGRLDMEATAQTGNLGIHPGVLRLLRIRLPTVGPIPLALINEASAVLSNRVAHMRITGTVSSPVVRIDPIRLLTEETVRFFLLRPIIGVP